MVLPPLNLLPEARPEKAIGKSSVLINPLLRLCSLSLPYPN